MLTKSEVKLSKVNPVQIDVPGFDNVYVHSEHENETGTHKDWKAATLGAYIDIRSTGFNHNASEQVYSILSSGSAAIAFQNILKKKKMPDLRVLIDEGIDKDILESLEKIGCKVYQTLLGEKALDEHEILKLTDNFHGTDLTSAHDNIFHQSYLPLAMKLLSGSGHELDRIVIPYGTGELYNAFNFMAMIDVLPIFEHFEKVIGQRIPYPSNLGKPISIIGATSNNPQTKMSKLYAPALPFLPKLQNLGGLNILQELMKYSKKLRHSGIVNISDNYLDQAGEIFDDHNIPAEPSALSSLAMLLENPDRFKPDEKILLVSTGKCKI